MTDEYNPLPAYARIPSGEVSTPHVHVMEDATLGKNMQTMLVKRAKVPQRKTVMARTTRPHHRKKTKWY